MDYIGIAKFTKNKIIISIKPYYVKKMEYNYYIYGKMIGNTKEVLLNQLF
jgi:hypothetical protein